MMSPTLKRNNEKCNSLKRSVGGRIVGLTKQLCFFQFQPDSYKQREVKCEHLHERIFDVRQELKEDSLTTTSNAVYTAKARDLVAFKASSTKRLLGSLNVRLKEKNLSKPAPNYQVTNRILVSHNDRQSRQQYDSSRWVFFCGSYTTGNKRTLKKEKIAKRQPSVRRYGCFLSLYHKC